MRLVRDGQWGELARVSFEVVGSETDGGEGIARNTLHAGGSVACAGVALTAAELAALDPLRRLPAGEETNEPADAKATGGAAARRQPHKHKCAFLKEVVGD